MDEPLPGNQAANETSELEQIAKPREKRVASSTVHRLLVPIVCSLLGTAILAVQTYILYQQKRLLATQTQVLSLDQSVHLRERIVVASSVDDSIRRLVRAMKAEASTQINAPANLGGLSQITNFAVNACQNDKCSTAIVNSELGALAGENFHIDSDVARGLLRLSVYLEQLDLSIAKVLDAPSELDLNKSKPDKTIAVRKLIDDGITRCFFDPVKGRDLSENLARLRLVSGNAMWIQMPVGTPDRFERLSGKFAQVGTNTAAGLERLHEAAFEIILAAGKDPLRVTLQEFPAILANDYQAALAGLVDLDRMCTETIAHDASAMKSIADSPMR